MPPLTQTHEHSCLVDPDLMNSGKWHKRRGCTHRSLRYNRDMLVTGV